MPGAILDGLLVVDVTGWAILATTATTTLSAVLLTLVVRARYAGLERDLRDNGVPDRRFSSDLLTRIAREGERALRGSRNANVQAIIEEAFQSDLKTLLLAERFLKSATGLVIILGLLGTFYGLTLSIGRLVHLVSADQAAVSDVAQAVTGDLTRALSGMAVAFSNSLVGIGSAVILTVLGVFANVADRRVGLMLRIETYLDWRVHEASNAETATLERRHGASIGVDADRIHRTVVAFGESAARLDGAVTRFESALQAFATTTRDFREFNLHLKDNVQRMSLCFGDLSETLQAHADALKSGDR
jgi:hypothetical protein